VDSNASEHIDKGVDAEEVDLPLVKVADARLGDTEQFCGLGLFQALRFDRFAEVNHQGRTDLQVFGFLGGETKIPENDRTSSREDPTQKMAFSDTRGVYKILYGVNVA